MFGELLRAADRRLWGKENVLFGAERIHPRDECPSDNSEPLMVMSCRQTHLEIVCKVFVILAALLRTSPYGRASSKMGQSQDTSR